MQITKTYWTILWMLVSVTTYAQLGTSSPYSISGLGDLQYGGFTQHEATGGTSISQQSLYNFTPLNPASYANIGFTIYDAGAKMSLGKLAVSDKEAQTRSGNFNYFAMAFPFETQRKMAVSFGLKQFSDVGYDIKNTVNTDTPTYYNLFKGEGGISKVYLGYGVSLLPNLNIGANVNFNFGTIQSYKAKVFPISDNSFSFSDETYFSYKGFDADFGVQYSVHDTVRGIGHKKFVVKHTIGAVLHSNTSLNGSGYRYSESFFGRAFDQGSYFPIDTLLFNDNQKETIEKPVGVGLAYTLSKGEQWAISAEMEQAFWSGITDKFTGNKFNDNMKYSIGFSVIPKPAYGDKGGYLKKVRYSAGLRYENLYYNFNNTQLSELGISFGLGIPVIKSVRIEDEKMAVVSRVNLTVQYVKRGTTTNGLIQEDYINIGLGLNLNDKWFTKRKYH